MFPLKSIDSLYFLLAFIVPGLIVLFVRSQFVTGRRPSHPNAILSYLTVSVVYYALILPVVAFLRSITGPSYGKAMAWFAVVFLGPVVLGVLLGIGIQNDLLRGFLRRCGLNPVHVMPTAWDWKFGNMDNEWVLVTLKDGTRFAGFCGAQSFISSDPAERDIYVQWIYDIDDNHHWQSRGRTGSSSPLAR